MLRTTLLSFLIMPLFALAQNEPFEYKESLDQPHMPVNPQHRRTSPPYRLDGTAFSIRQVNVDDAGQNILNDAANEPSLVIDPTNPQRMAIGWRQFDTIASNFRQAGVAFSFDAGETWQNQAPIEQGIFRSDPVLDADTEGNFYYNSLSSSTGDFLCHVFKSEAGSNTWGSGVFAQGGDKQWMAIDRTGTGSNGNVYAFWKMGISSCVGGFTRSLDGGETYEPCELLVDDPVRGTLVVSPTGELYACGSSANSFVVLKSSQPGAPVFEWDQVTSVNLGGPLSYGTGPNPGGMLGQVWVDVDNSGGPNQGFVYLLATVNNGIDPADIILARSTDGGLTWGDPVRINDDGSDGNWQWFGSLSVAPTGRIDATWFDTRDNPGTFLSRLYYSYSEDGGLTWSPNEGLTDAFDPHLGWPQQQKLGDYNHQRSDSLGAHLAWAATLNGEQDVFYSYIQPNYVSSSQQVAEQQNNVSVVPNPFTGSTSFRFSMQKPGHVRVVIMNAQGRMVEVLDAGHLGAGEQVVEWGDEAGAGLFFYSLNIDGTSMAAGKLVKVEP